MRKIILFIVIAVLVSCDNKSVSKDKDKTEKECIEIKLNPHRGNEIKLSSIIDSLAIIRMETSSDCLLGDILKIEIDDNYFIQSASDKLVYVFNSYGKYVNTIGRIGQGREEMGSPQHFSMNKTTKEIWYITDFRAIKKYAYDGRYTGSEEMKVLCHNFKISDDGDRYFYTSKIHNYLDDGTVVNADLWIENGQKDNKYLFEYNPDIYCNGCLAFDSKLQFNELDKNVSFTKSFNDTIYYVSHKQITPAYLVDFNSNKATADIEVMSGENILKYLLNNPDKATYVHNVIETEQLLRFNYVMGTQLYDVFYNKETGDHREGVLNNDLLEGKIKIMGYRDNKLIAIMNPTDICFNDKVTAYCSLSTITALKEIKDDDNPIILEMKINI